MLSYKQNLSEETLKKNISKKGFFENTKLMRLLGRMSDI